MRITGLPFRFEVMGDVRQLAPAILRVELEPGYSQDQFNQLCCVVVWFSALGQWGVLGGTIIAPVNVRVELDDNEPAYGDNAPTWNFRALAIDPAACTVLANLIYATALPIHSVLVRAPGPSDGETHPCDYYPGRWSEISFEVEEDRTDRNVQIVVDFSCDLNEELHEEVSNAFRYWSMVAALGGFREPGPLKDRIDLVPEDEPEIILDQLTLTIRDNGLHDAAFDALVHLCAGMARRGINVDRLEMG